MRPFVSYFKTILAHRSEHTHNDSTQSMPAAVASTGTGNSGLALTRKSSRTCSAQKKKKTKKNVARLFLPNYCQGVLFRPMSTRSRCTAFLLLFFSWLSKLRHPAHSRAAALNASLVPGLQRVQNCAECAGNTGQAVELSTTTVRSSPHAFHAPCNAYALCYNPCKYAWEAAVIEPSCAPTSRLICLRIPQPQRRHNEALTCIACLEAWRQQVERG